MSETNYLGFGNLPSHVQRKNAKKGYEFTLMVVGESGLGKTTLTNSLFMTKINLDKTIPPTEDLLKRTLTIATNSVDIEDRGVRLKLTIVDTPGYGDALNCSENFEPIINYIDQQYERYLNHESGLNRRQIRDTRVHCCFYFISPMNHGLKPADVQFLKLLQYKVNIIPLIAKSDFLTPNETKVLKQKILDEIREHKIQIYSLPECEQDEDAEYKSHLAQLKNSIPFAVSSSIEVHEIKGRKVRGREYPWGIVETENPDHSDFIKLRSLLVSHMQDLRDVTNDVHYENYRAQRLSGTISPSKFLDSVSILSGSGIDDTEKDRILQEKDAELKKMQEMLAKMQEEMLKQQKLSSENVPCNGNGCV